MLAVRIARERGWPGMAKIIERLHLFAEGGHRAIALGRVKREPFRVSL